MSVLAGNPTPAALPPQGEEENLHKTKKPHPQSETRKLNSKISLCSSKLTDLLVTETKVKENKLKNLRTSSGLAGLSVLAFLIIIKPLHMNSCKQHQYWYKDGDHAEGLLGDPREAQGSH